MATSGTQEQRNLQLEKTRIERALEEQKTPEFEGFDESRELTGEQAAQLQPHMGNCAIQDLMDRLGEVDSALSELEQEQAQQEELDEDVDLESELEGQSFGGGGAGAGAGGGSGAGNPWEFELFLGGDDDAGAEEAAIRRRRNRRRVDILHSPDVDEEQEPAHKSDLEYVMGLLADPVQGPREGDSVYEAVERALLDVGELCCQSLDPQDLAERQGVADPVRTPVEIGRFLAESAQTPLSRSLAELLGAPAAALMAPQGGFSTAVARLATLAVCTEAAEGRGTSTDRAVSFSLRHEAWPDAVELARELAQSGQLHAPLICSSAFGEQPAEEEPLPSPCPLGGQALHRILPPELGVPAPYLALKRQEARSEDPLVAFLDAQLEELTGGAREPEPIGAEVLQPALHSANRLLTALGRTQVELAAAGIAVRRVHGSAPVTATLAEADKVLRRLARAVITAGRSLEELRGRPQEDADAAGAAIRTLSDTCVALSSLREWGLSTLAGSAAEAG